MNYKLSILILANKEVDSLLATIENIHKYVKVDYEVVLITKNADCPSSKVAEKILREHQEWKVVHAQQKTHDKMELLWEIVSCATGTHLLCWCADREVEAESIPQLLCVSLQKPEAIVCLSKFHKQSVLIGYGRIRKLVRRTLNTLIKVLFRKEGEDIFSPLEIFPRRYLQDICYSAPKYFMFEYTLIPLKLGVEYVEIPVRINKITEGTKLSLLFNFRMTLLYLFCILKVYFTPNEKLWKHGE